MTSISSGACRRFLTRPSHLRLARPNSIADVCRSSSPHSLTSKQSGHAHGAVEKDPIRLWSRYVDWLYQHKPLGLFVDVIRIGFTEELLERMEPPMQRAFAAMRELGKGAIGNPDEGRMVGHYWMRCPGLAPNSFLRAKIETTLERILAFASDIISAKIKPPSSPAWRFTQILSIGIGGSSLGPQFVAEVLAPDNPPLKNAALETLELVMTQALTMANTDRSVVRAVCLAVSGVNHPSDQQRMLDWIQDLFPRHAKFYVKNDAVAALASGTMGKLHGCVLIAGTGSIAYGVTEDGKVARAAGAGPVLGDWGSLEIVARARRRKAAGGRPGLADLLSLSSSEEVDEDAVVELGEADTGRKQKKNRRKAKKKQRKEAPDAAAAAKEEVLLGCTPQLVQGSRRNAPLWVGAELVWQR